MSPAKELPVVKYLIAKYLAAPLSLVAGVSELAVPVAVPVAVSLPPPLPVPAEAVVPEHFRHELYSTLPLVGGQILFLIYSIIIGTMLRRGYKGLRHNKPQLGPKIPVNRCVCFNKCPEK